MPQTQLKKIKINGTELHYLDLGEAVPVVLVHGGGATDYRTWTLVVDRFAEEFHVIVPSLRYHYPNEWLGDGSDYSPITHAQDVAALINGLRIAPAHIIGSSFGANIALVLARDFHDLVRSLVLAEPPLYDWIQASMTVEERETD